MTLTYGNSFVQMLCDLQACHTMIQEHERKVGRPFVTVARLRLDLAWETPLIMPEVMHPGVVYTSRMNTKSGLNDKWGVGLRETMRPYLDRVQLIEEATRLYNRSAPMIPVRASGGKAGLFHYSCPTNSNNVAFVCHPRRPVSTQWQLPDATGHTGNRRFGITSEAFLLWSLCTQVACTQVACTQVACTP